MNSYLSGLGLFIIALVLISGCTDVSDQFKKEVEHSNSLVSSSVLVFLDGASSKELASVKSASTLLDRDIRDAQIRIEAISGTNQTLKDNYINSLKTVDEAALVFANIDAMTLLSSKNTYQMGADAGSKIKSGMDGMFSVEATWNKDAGKEYEEKLSKY